MACSELTPYLDDLTKAVFSQPCPGTEYQKITICPVHLKGRIMYQLERFSGTKVYHLNLEKDDLFRTVAEEYYGNYRQILINTEKESHQFTLKKNGKYKRSTKQAVARPAGISHNREKNYLLREGENIPAFVDLGIFTKDLKIVNSKYDKYRQINRFIEIIDDEFKNFSGREVSILDFGCGKSYLTFIIYYYFSVKKGLNVKIIGYDLKEDVVENCNKIAERYGYDHLKFVVADVTKDVLSDEHIDIVVSLHACDTATDHALFYAVSRNVSHIFSVPCCQHEINNTIAKGGDMDLLLRHGIVKERVSALLTDSIRASLLEDMGYSVDMIEFIDFENSPKNIMLRAKKTHAPDFKNISECEALAARYSFSQTLLELIRHRYR